MRDNEDFYTCDTIKEGYSYSCKSCMRAKNIEYRNNHREKVNESCRKWYKKNKEKAGIRKKRYMKNNPHIYAKNNAKRRAKKLNATIGNYDVELDIIYNKCPSGYHVDHIVPLNNNLVCGLHVPWNLQYLSPIENLKKGNKFEV